MMAIPFSHRRPRRGGFPYAEESVTDALAKLPPEDKPLGSLVQATAQDEAPRPTFTPRASGPQTRADLAIPVISGPLSRAFPVPLTVRPVIGDSLRAPEPREPATATETPGNGAMLYSGPGWTRALTAARLANGELEELPALVEQGYGRNAAGFATVARHFRERITATAEQVCAAMGRPDLAGPLLRRVEQYNAQARMQDRGAA